jgi:predicted site-specific integrase-resolvase
LKHQVAFLRSYANGKGIILDDVITDIGSGLDYRRKKWNALLEEVLDSQIDTIYVAFKDRFVRFGYEWFERLCMAFGTNIVVLNNPDLSPREEIVEDLAAVMHVFSSRIHGLEKYKKQIEGDKSIAGALKADSETKAEG